MAGFAVRLGNKMEEEYELTFRGGECVNDFLKPEEVGRTVVSDPVDFHLEAEGMRGWFGAKFEAVLAQGPGSPEDFVKHAGSGQLRVVITRLAGSCTHAEQNDWEPKMEKIPVKIKILASIPLSAPRSQRKRSHLSQITETCGGRVWLDMNGICTEANGRIVSKYALNWNETDLCWESRGNQDAVLFRREHLSEFEGSKVEENGVTMWIMKPRLTMYDAEVAQALQRLFAGPGDGWRKQKELLESQEFADVVLICRDFNFCRQPLLCHKGILAGASSVLAKILREPSARKWSTTDIPVVEFPESTKVGLALLDFIYYGGADKLWNLECSGDVLEVLKAAHKYQIEGLVHLCAFKLCVRAVDLDVGVEMFHFTRHLEGNVWRELRKEGLKCVQGWGKSEKRKSKGFQRIYKIAVKLGPAFVELLKFRPVFTRCNELELLSILSSSESETEQGAKRKPKLPSSAGWTVSKENATLLYDLFSCGKDFKKPRSVDVAVGLILLAEYCDRPLPNFESEDLARQFSFLQNRFMSIRKIDVDYVVELFCLARTKKEECWKQLKMEAVRNLKKLLVEQPDRIRNSEKYLEMLRMNPEAFEEFTWLSNKECVCKKEKQNGFNS